MLAEGVLQRNKRGVRERNEDKHLLGLKHPHCTLLLQRDKNRKVNLNQVTVVIMFP